MGRVPYGGALSWQHERREAVIAGGGEVFALLEHPRVVTTGRRGEANLERVRATGISVVQTKRGGLATWHGPGQLVGYPIVDLGRRRIRIQDFVRALEQGVIDWLVAQGVRSNRREGLPGVWIGSHKICAVGTHFRKGVSMHGFALNLHVDLSDYSLFTPCGIVGGGVTSAHLHGVRQLPAEAAGAVAIAVLLHIDTPARRV